MNMEQTECSETSAYKLQTPENYPEESIQHLERGESLKSEQKPFIVQPLNDSTRFIRVIGLSGERFISYFVCCF
jgi:hypothetical protein